MHFSVRAITAEGHIVQTDMEAVDQQDALRLIAERGLHLIAIRPSRRSAGARGARFSLLLFSQELLALLRAGLSLTEAFEALLEKSRTTEGGRILERLSEALREGRKFSDALADQPQSFPPLYVGLIRAAEGTSNLVGTLERYIAYQTRVDQIRGKLISAAIYPSILCLVGTGITLFLLGYVVPRFSLVYQDSGRDIPYLSKLLMQLGLGIANNWPFVLVTCATVLIFCVYYLRSGKLAAALVRLAQRLPHAGDQVRLYELSRIYLTLGMLIEGGIPLPQAIQTIEGVVSDTGRAQLQSAGKDLHQGLPASHAFEHAGLATSISLRMLRVGERSGQLAEMLMQAAAFYETDISRFVDRFTRAFEPMLMAFLGILIGGLVMLLYMPIFDLADALQ